MIQILQKFKYILELFYKYDFEYSQKATDFWLLKMRKRAARWSCKNKGLQVTIQLLFLQTRLLKETGLKENGH